MSRKGKIPITVPKGVEASVVGNIITVKGPKGSLSQEYLDCVTVTCGDDEIVVSLKDADKKNFHGLYRTLIDNMVIGVTKGYEKILEMQGVGFRAAVKGNAIDLQVGFSHPTIVDIPEGLTAKVDKNTLITITGIDKQLVGQFAAYVRAKRPPEPYKGKGIRYRDEHVRRKAGKSAKK
jgi:large subunit ribosomal protein L6